MKIPTISSYGEYKGNGYGMHCLKLEFNNGFTLYQSYDTTIAFRKSYGEPLVIRQNDWSTTTGKHLNWIDKDKKKRLKSAEFEQKLEECLKELNLA